MRRWNDLVAAGSDDRCGHVDLANPIGRVETADLAPSGQHLGPIMSNDLFDCPCPITAPFEKSRPCCLWQPSEGPEWTHRRQRRRALEYRKRRSTRARVIEPATCRTEYEAANSRTVAAPDQRRDGSAHRVADRDEAFDIKRIGERHGVISAVFEAKTLGCLQTLSVAAMVEGNDAVSTGQRSLATVPREVRSRRPPVEQHHDRCTRRTTRLMHEGGAATWELYATPGREYVGASASRRGCGARSGPRRNAERKHGCGSHHTTAIARECGPGHDHVAVASTDRSRRWRIPICRHQCVRS